MLPQGIYALEAWFVNGISNVKENSNETHNRISFADACIHRRGLWAGGNIECRVQRKLLPGWLRKVLHGRLVQPLLPG